MGRKSRLKRERRQHPETGPARRRAEPRVTAPPPKLWTTAEEIAADLARFTEVLTRPRWRTVAEALPPLDPAEAHEILADMRRRTEASEIPASVVDMGALLIPRLTEAE